MDYCHQCQRHLNGALACPGCGTPVEELRHDDDRTPAAEHVYELDRVVELPPAAPRRAREGRAGERRAREGRAQQGAATRRARPASRRARPVGRRARRRRGRTVLVGLAGLVLAAGLLSLAELAMEHPGEDGAATAIQQDDRAVPQPPPDRPQGSGAPEDPSPVTEPVVATSGTPDRPEGGADGVDGDAAGESGAPSRAPGAAASGGAARGGAAAGTGGEPGGGEEAPPEQGGPEEPGAPDGPGGPQPQDPEPQDPGATGDPDEPAPGDPGPGDPPPAEPPPPPPPPAPEPSPSETCDWFLWWCV
ncbi:hypothetical protein [Streptomyces sp. NPDC015131]|uniref:SCO2400 family protein n=1 Tax=Streptomyces sp. NPDC015131 TaxID=3364941 RepID=UPI0036F72AA2